MLREDELLAATAAIDFTSRRVWDRFVAGHRCESPQASARVLGGLLQEICATADSENAYEQIAHESAVIAHCALCSLVDRLPASAWYDGAALEAEKQHVIDEVLAMYEGRAQQKILGRKPN